MFNYSSPSVKNSALLALASIPHKLADRPIFGIWCGAVLLFLLFSWPASTPEELGKHTLACTLANRHAFRVANIQTNGNDATYLSAL